MAHLTRRGARNVTAELDRLANLFQHRFESLGIPLKIAADFAYRCDILSDYIEKHAIRLAAEHGEDDASDDEPEEDDDSSDGKTASEEKVAAKDETGESVDKGESGFDANAIADETSGPIESQPDEGYMKQNFTNQEFSELREKQQNRQLPPGTNKLASSLERLRRLANASSLSSLQDALKACHASLLASDLDAVKALAPAVKKQIDAIGKVRDLQIKQQAEGGLDVEIEAAADRIAQAVGEQLPYLREVVSGVDAASPTALLDFQKSVGGDSLKQLISLGAQIVEDAAKGLSAGGAKEASEDESDATASEVEASEEPVESDVVASEDEDSEDEDSEESDATASEDEDSDDEAETSKSASADCFGFDLFAV